MGGESRIATEVTLLPLAVMVLGHVQLALGKVSLQQT